jgi:hypothetical protein
VHAITCNRAHSVSYLQLAANHAGETGVDGAIADLSGVPDGGPQVRPVDRLGVELVVEHLLQLESHVTQNGVRIVNASQSVEMCLLVRLLDLLLDVAFLAICSVCEASIVVVTHKAAVSNTYVWSAWPCDSPGSNSDSKRERNSI